MPDQPRDIFQEVEPVAPPTEKKSSPTAPEPQVPVPSAVAIWKRIRLPWLLTGSFVLLLGIGTSVYFVRKNNTSNSNTVSTNNSSVSSASVTTSNATPTVVSGSLDTDADGLSDEEETSLKTNVKMPDTDGDGVLDNVDWEINSPAGCKVDVHGVCPKEEKPVWGGAYNLPTVYFDLDKSIVKKDYMIELQRTALLMYANPTMKLDIVGNTDKHHSDDYNDKLGMRRAKAVADILIQRFNVPADRINVKSNGKHILKSPNDELNRRVDIIPAQ